MRRIIVFLLFVPFSAIANDAQPCHDHLKFGLKDKQEQIEALAIAGIERSKILVQQQNEEKKTALEKSLQEESMQEKRREKGKKTKEGQKREKSQES